MTPQRIRGLAHALLTSVLWGTVPVAGKVALGGMSAPLLSALRLAVAALLLRLLLARRRAPVPSRPPPLLLLAAFGLGANYVAYMAGLQYAGAGTAQVLIQTAPVFLLLMGVFSLGERLGPAEIVGAAVAFLGVLLVSWREASTTGGLLGISLILVAALAWAVYAVAQKIAGRTLHSGGATFWVFLLASLFNVPGAAVAAPRTLDLVALLAVAYLCLNTFVAYWSFAESLRHIPASTAAVIATLGPAVTFSLLAVTNAMHQDRVPHEPITLVKVAGALLVVGGVIATVRAHASSPDVA